MLDFMGNFINCLFGAWLWESFYSPKQIMTILHATHFQTESDEWDPLLLQQIIIGLKNWHFFPVQKSIESFETLCIHRKSTSIATAYTITGIIFY